MTFCWAVLGAPNGKRLAPITGELVPRSRRLAEPMVTAEVACASIAMSPATIDRRLAGERARMTNHHLLDWSERREITFTRSRPGNSNDGAHVEQQNWAIVRTVADHHRYVRFVK